MREKQPLQDRARMCYEGSIQEKKKIPHPTSPRKAGGEE